MLKRSKKRFAEFIHASREGTSENKGAEAGLLGAHGMSLTEHLLQRADIKKIFARLTIGIRVGVLRA